MGQSKKHESNTNIRFDAYIYSLFTYYLLFIKYIMCEKKSIYCGKNTQKTH